MIKVDVFFIFLALVLAVALGRCEPAPTAEIVVQLEWPKKRESRLQRYWFITATRGYEL